MAEICTVVLVEVGKWEVCYVVHYIGEGYG